MPRKVFVAGEILTAADVNTNLMDQAVMVFDDDTARGSAIPSPSEGMVTYLKDTDSVEKYDGSNFVGIADPPAILQVVQVEKTDTFVETVASGAVVDVTGMSATITPSSTSSKVLVSMHVSGSLGSLPGTESATDYGGIIRRDGTGIGLGDTAGSRTRVTFGGQTDTARIPGTSHAVLDSPNTTSAVTYSFHVLNTMLNTSSFFLNRPSSAGTNDNDAARTPRGASRIILMEVAG